MHQTKQKTERVSYMFRNVELKEIQDITFHKFKWNDREYIMSLNNYFSADFALNIYIF